MTSPFAPYTPRGGPIGGSPPPGTGPAAYTPEPAPIYKNGHGDAEIRDEGVCNGVPEICKKVPRDASGKSAGPRGLFLNRRPLARKTGSIFRGVERRRIIASFKVFSVPPDERAEIMDALNSEQWDWFRDCDGCTCVSESYWPTRFFPPCLRHDYDWFVGHPVWSSNLRFYRLSRRYRMSRMRAGWRFVGVTLGWYGFFKWRHMWLRRGGAEPKAEIVEPTWPSGARVCAGCARPIDPNEFPGVNEAGQWICTACEEKQATGGDQP